MSRWAVLWDVSHGNNQPVGLAVEHPGHVHVFAPHSYGVPTRFSGEYRVLQPDGSLVTYRPSMEGYFDQVLVELSRAFGVGKQSSAASQLDTDDVLTLLVREVLTPQRSLATGEYVLAPRSVDHHHDESSTPYSPRRVEHPRRAERPRFSVTAA